MPISDRFHFLNILLAHFYKLLSAYQPNMYDIETIVYMSCLYSTYKLMFFMCLAIWTQNYERNWTCVDSINGGIFYIWSS